MTTKQAHALARLPKAIAWLQEQSGVGLINDDFGRWAVAEGGWQNLPDIGVVDDPFDLYSTFFISKDRFRGTILEAIELAMEDQGQR